MKNELVIAIVAAAATLLAAVITGIITVFVQGRSLKRDGNTISSIHRSCSEEIAPTVKELRLLQNDQTTKLDALVSDLDHRKRMEAAAGSNAVNSRDAAFKTIDTLFEQYAAAQKEIASLRQQVAQLKKENKMLCFKYGPQQGRDFAEREPER